MKTWQPCQTGMLEFSSGVLSYICTVLHNTNTRRGNRRHSRELQSIARVHVLRRTLHRCDRGQGGVSFILCRYCVCFKPLSHSFYKFTAFCVYP